MGKLVIVTVTKFQQCIAPLVLGENLVSAVLTHCLKNSLTFEKYEACAGLVSRVDEEGD